MDLPQDKWFYFSDGSGAKNLNELKAKLEVISYSDFYNHVADGKNDFANWVRYVLGDPHLADDLEKVDSIVESVEILNDYTHPGVAKQHLDAQDDIQSKIEKDVGITDFTSEETPESTEPMEPEASPEEPIPEPEVSDWSEPVEAAAEEPAQESEPSKHESSEPEQEPASAVGPAPTPKFEQDDEDNNDVTAAAISTHFKKEAGEKKEIESFHHDIGTLIVKDFIIGLIFGLVVGFLLARMITIF